IVILIVVTAGMVSTTWVQFLKGSLLVIFSAVLTVIILNRGFVVNDGGEDGYHFQTIGPIPASIVEEQLQQIASSYGATVVAGDWTDKGLIRSQYDNGAVQVWHLDPVEDETALGTDGAEANAFYLREGQIVTTTADGKVLVNGLPRGTGEGETQLHPVGWVSK